MSTFRTSRELNASPGAVFAAIQDPARLARWWGPKGFTNTFERFAFEVGGEWVYTMHGPNGRDYPNAAEFLEIVPGSRVRLRHVVLPYYELTIELAPCPAGTRVEWTQTFDKPEVAKSLAPIVGPANEENLDRLAVEVSTRSSVDLPLRAASNRC